MATKEKNKLGGLRFRVNDDCWLDNKLEVLFSILLLKFKAQLTIAFLLLSITIMVTTSETWKTDTDKMNFCFLRGLLR